ncbi:sensor histidine kinase [Chitinophaga silvatica]|nr:histidine kinase [Chitinophaga silvatica]
MLVHDWTSAFHCLAVSFFHSLTCSEGARLLVFSIRRYYPGNRNMTRRLPLMLLYGLPLMFVIAGLNHFFAIAIEFYYKVKWEDYFFVDGITILCSLLVVGLYEGLYYISQWKNLFIESERLKKSNLDSQYKFLKDQIKPHFLFNSLNTLSSLISTNPEKAEEFVEEMAAVYRYLLKKNRKELTTFKEERIFLESYLLMLRTRFEDSLRVNIAVSESKEEYLLPPFVLQILIENAVKHNIVSKDKPLTINIYTDIEDNLHIENTLQRKQNPEPSDKTGLQNLLSRYQLINHENRLMIREEDGLFKVVIPLIHINKYENIVE